MKCLLISPRNGVIRISRFTAADLQPSDAEPPAFSKERDVRFGDLDQRCAAPLQLSKALQARLLCRTHRGLRAPALRQS